jgi:hypothetical protein
MDADEVLTVAAGQLGAPYLMTADQVLAHLVMGNRRHNDAPAVVCGMVDPRDEQAWCIRQPGHDGNHNRYVA